MTAIGCKVDRGQAVHRRGLRLACGVIAKVFVFVNQPTGLDIIFPHEYLRAALMVSLLSVWVLVGLFYYLNHYTRRDYFTIWTAAWLFYALWLTLCLRTGETTPGSILFMVKQSCVSISAVLLLWGS